MPLLRQVGVVVLYKGIRIPLGFRAEVLATVTVIVEFKIVPALLPAH